MTIEIEDVGTDEGVDTPNESNVSEVNPIERPDEVKESTRVEAPNQSSTQEGGPSADQQFVASMGSYREKKSSSGESSDTIEISSDSDGVPAQGQQSEEPNVSMKNVTQSVGVSKPNRELEQLGKVEQPVGPRRARFTGKYQK